MVPNLNKWKFIKLHRKKRARSLGKGNKGKQLKIYNFGVVLKSSQLITINQLDSFKKYVNKRLKKKERTNRKNPKQVVKKKLIKRAVKEKTVIIRQNFNLGLTKKPLQVRMGKGKGAPVDWVYPYSKDRILLEFIVKKFKFNKLRRIFWKAENKLAGKLRVVKLVSKEKKTNRSFFKRVTCVKEL